MHAIKDMPSKIGHLVLHNILWRKKQTFFMSPQDKNKSYFPLVYTADKHTRRCCG